MVRLGHVLGLKLLKVARPTKESLVDRESSWVEFNLSQRLLDTL